MDGITSASPIAFLGSLLAHAAIGAAFLGFGPVSPRKPPQPSPVELIAFETIEPAVEPPAQEILEEPPVIRRVLRPAPAPAAPLTAPPSAVEPPVAAPPVAVEPPAVEPPAVDPTPTMNVPAVGLPADSTVATEAKGFAVGASGVGAKTNGPSHAGPGSVSLDGVVGGRGDRSRAAGLADGRTWDCPFPQEAEDEGIEDARVTLQVEIGADGSMLKTTVVNDPGFGFGHEARRCAMRRRWSSQLDRAGTPVAGRATVVVHFVR